MPRLRTALLALALLAAPADALAADGRIVFDSSRAVDYDIYTMDGDGSDVRRLTSAKGWELEPKWSPEGGRIAFQSRRDEQGNISVMNADGGAQTQLTQTPERYLYNQSPVWAPSGATLMFSSNAGVGGGALWTIGADGSAAAQLTWFGATKNAITPAYSPDGTRVAFASTHETGEFDSDLYVMNADGTGLVRLTATPGTAEGDPAWSPDGSLLAYVTDLTPGGSTIDVMRPDGTGRRTVTSGFQDGGPAWSPDGRRLAFNRIKLPIVGETVDIYVVDAAGGTPRRLTHGTDDEHSANPHWIAGGDELGPLEARASGKRVAVSFTIAAPAQVTLSVDRCKRGAGATCKRGTRIARAGFAAAAGRQARTLAARRTLRPGRYRLTATTPSDGRSTVFRVYTS